MSEEKNIPKGQPLALDEVRSLLESGMAVQLTILCNAKTFNVGYIYSKNSRGERYYERYYFNPYGDISTAKKEEVWDTCEDLMGFLNKYVQDNNIELVKIDYAETEKYSWDCRLESGIWCKDGEILDTQYAQDSWRQVIYVLKWLFISCVGFGIFYKIFELYIYLSKHLRPIRIPDWSAKWISDILNKVCFLIWFILYMLIDFIMKIVFGLVAMAVLYFLMVFIAEVFFVLRNKMRGETVKKYSCESIIDKLYLADDCAAFILQHGLDRFTIGYYLRYDLMDKYKYAIPEEVIASGKGTGLFDKEHKEEYYFIDNHYYLFWEDFERDLRKYEQNGEFSVIEINQSKKKQ